MVQDLVLRAQVIRYRRERWVTPDGQMVVAPLPSGIAGHFGPELRRFILLQHHQSRVTVERWLLEPIGNILPAEAEERYYASLEHPEMAA